MKALFSPPSSHYAQETDYVAPSKEGCRPEHLRRTLCREVEDVAGKSGSVGSRSRKIGENNTRNSLSLGDGSFISASGPASHSCGNLEIEERSNTLSRKIRKSQETYKTPVDRFFKFFIISFVTVGVAKISNYRRVRSPATQL